MRDLLGPSGENWCQSMFFSEDGQMCLEGAVLKALYGDTLQLKPNPLYPGRLVWGLPDGDTRYDERVSAFRLLTEAAHTALGQEYANAIQVNDEHGRSWSEIDLILKHAEQKWDEEHA